MIYLNDNNIYVGQIKQLLKNFNLPTCKVCKTKEDEDFYKTIPSMHYIRNNKVYTEGKVVSLYKENDKIINLTKSLQFSNNLYDSYTHRYLGDYLRFQRDYNNLNLMSMYNCVDDNMLSVDLPLEQSFESNYDSFKVSDGAYVIYAVPVKFGQKYTIGIDCALTISMFAGFYSNNKLLFNELSEIRQLRIDSFRKISNLSLTKPYLFNGLEYSEINSALSGIEEEDKTKVLNSESNLKLFIKVPIDCKSSLVVLEGDYTNCNKFVFATNSLSNIVINHKNAIIEELPSLISNLELLSYYNLTDNALLATKLIEYLSGNVITNISEYYDIEKAQRKLIKNKYVKSDYLGIWSKEDTLGLMSYIDKNKVDGISIKSKYFDILPYVDKDIEKDMGDIE